MLLSKGGQTDCASEADPLARVLNTSCARPITVLNGSCQACVMPGAVPGPRGGARMQARHGLFISDIFFFLFSVKKNWPKRPKATQQSEKTHNRPRQTYHARLACLPNMQRRAWASRRDTQAGTIQLVYKCADVGRAVPGTLKAGPAHTAEHAVIHPARPTRPSTLSSMIQSYTSSFSMSRHKSFLPQPSSLHSSATSRFKIQNPKQKQTILLPPPPTR